jgi:hypothetical protein
LPFFLKTLASFAVIVIALFLGAFFVQ